MELLTEDLRARLKPISDPAYDRDDPIVHAKFFAPVAKWIWLVTAGQAVEDDYLFFGYVIGDENDWGSFALSELEGVKLPLGQKIERDLHFTSKPFSELPITLSEEEIISRLAEAEGATPVDEAPPGETPVELPSVKPAVEEEPLLARGTPSLRLRTVACKLGVSLRRVKRWAKIGVLHTRRYDHDFPPYLVYEPVVTRDEFEQFERTFKAIRAVFRRTRQTQRARIAHPKAPT